MGSSVNVSNLSTSATSKTNVACKNIHKVVSNSDEVKVMSGEGSPSVFKQCRRVFYSKKYQPVDVKSLLVRPCSQAVKVYNATAHASKARSYARAIKNNNVARNNVSTTCKTRVFWANCHNGNKRGEVPSHIESES